MKALKNLCLKATVASKVSAVRQAGANNTKNMNQGADMTIGNPAVPCPR